MGLLSWIKRLVGASKDKELVCAECRKSFVFEEGEQKFFAQRGLTEPRRCPTCRKATRRVRGRRSR